MKPAYFAPTESSAVGSSMESSRAERGIGGKRSVLGPCRRKSDPPHRRRKAIVPAYAIGAVLLSSGLLGARLLDYTESSHTDTGGAARDFSTNAGSPYFSLNDDTTSGCILDDETLQSTLHVEATAVPCTITAPDDAVSFSFAVTNGGSSPLSAVTVDVVAFFGNGIRQPLVCRPEATVLAAGETLNCTSAYTTTRSDLEIQAVAMTALVAATTADNEQIHNSSTASAGVVSRILVQPVAPIAQTPSDHLASTGNGVNAEPFLLALCGAFAYGVALLAGHIVSRRGVRRNSGPIRHRRIGQSQGSQRADTLGSH